MTTLVVMLTASPQPLFLSIPRVQILYSQPVVIETTGYEADPDEPRVGEVVAVRIRLPHGVTDRYLEVGERHGEYRDVNGEPVEGVEIVSWRYPSADELADWEEAKKERERECAACDGSGFVTLAQDSGSWVVTPTCSDDPRAAPCDHKSGLEAWR